MKGDVTERGQSLGIAEAHVFVANITEDWRAATVLDPGYDPGLGGFVENLKDTFTCRAPGLHQLI
jgi:hypothetical protein